MPSRKVECELTDNKDMMTLHLNTCIVLLACCCALSLSSCDKADEDIVLMEAVDIAGDRPLVNNSVTITVPGGVCISVYNAEGECTVQSDQPDIVAVEMDKTIDNPYIRISGLRRGSANIVLTDSSNRQVSFSVVVAEGEKAIVIQRVYSRVEGTISKEMEKELEATSLEESGFSEKGGFRLTFQKQNEGKLRFVSQTKKKEGTFVLSPSRYIFDYTDGTKDDFLVEPSLQPKSKAVGPTYLNLVKDVTSQYQQAYPDITKIEILLEVQIN